MADRRRKAFTLVELLVVISIIGVLMGLLLPAVQSTRENGRRAVCNNNQKQLSLATLEFHHYFKRFPGYVNAVGPELKPVTWGVMLLPYIDRADIWTAWSKSTGRGGALKPYIDVFCCPSNPSPTELEGLWCYAANGGYQGDVLSSGTINEQPFHGVFFSHYSATGYNPSVHATMSLSYLSGAGNDGASTTLMLTENVQMYFPPSGSPTWPLGAPYNDSRMGWQSLYWNSTNTNADSYRGRFCSSVIWYTDEVPPAPLPANTRKINGDVGVTVADENHARPSSQHPQGVVAAFCDGHTKFINQAIDYQIYKQLMTSSGRQAFLAGTDPNNRRFNEGEF
jgi:prepilin-type N-terminal cleavage/methylation domain-containing protein